MSTTMTAEEPCQRSKRNHYNHHPVSWSVADFVGKFHLSRMTTRTPVPGTAIRIDQERNALIQKRASSLQATLDDIEARRDQKVKIRTRKEAIAIREHIKLTVGCRIDAGQKMYQGTTGKKKQRLSTARHRYTAADDFLRFVENVETNNVFQIKSQLRDRNSALRLVATAEKENGNTALHRSVSLGFVEITRILLESGANPDEVNTRGDAPIHCCWRFWNSDTFKHFALQKKRSLMTTSQGRKDFAKMEGDAKATVELLRLLTRGGADVDLRRNNGEVTLHTAARKGPLEAIWVLLLSNAAHDVVDCRMLTPEKVARQAGSDDFMALLANWSNVKLSYLDSEFVQEWMKFLRDPDAQLDTNLNAEEILSHVRMEEYEKREVVRARGGHFLIDEVVTGPVLPAERRDRASLVSSVDAISVASNADEIDRGDAPKSAAAGTLNEGHTPGSEGLDNWPIGPARGGRKKPTKSKLGKEIDVYLAEAWNKNIVGPGNEVLRRSTASSQLAAKMKLEARRNHCPGQRGNGGNLKTGRERSATDPFERKMTTHQRRRAAALEIAQDAEMEGPLLQPATSSILLTTRLRAAVRTTATHPYYGRRLLTRCLMVQREREASIKLYATIGVNQGRDSCTGYQPGAFSLKESRTAFNDIKLLPDPNKTSFGLTKRLLGGRLHAQHPVMMQRKLHERPYCELQGLRQHNEDVYCSISKSFCPRNWNEIRTIEPLLPVGGVTT